eukprot:CAMPEP_0197622686 /NCGR_PEP_ID=MMETSP1338-20131121/2884_1 /TAXON_ID=43686 ORGANISM="Pelagodinium beii, Strain RCC1491" /NCGR_SAMPLE_ID=MMETSP1338 /ASSEMBLY_ACC=CAM_ASM_000754 /LENGTH=289 /DNA_ID=CAMNT_0043192433 /DNA_START=54 /DNA_END=923 /DNA_ORIENTATION=-
MTRTKSKDDEDQGISELQDEQIRDRHRSYDPKQESAWQERYRFFSGAHMKEKFRTYASARHDPFNKDPSWGKAVMHKIRRAAEEKKMNLAEVFKQYDFSGDGLLDRTEMRRVLLGVIPSLSDIELAAVFDVVDANGDGDVSIDEFCSAVLTAKPISKETQDRWRNPVHKMPRISPAVHEGWDHLAGKTATMPGRPEDLRDSKISRRLREVSSPRSLKHELLDKQHRHKYFGGGNDTTRFRRQQWKENAGYGVLPRPLFEDPGPDIRPGFLCAEGLKVMRSPRPLHATLT